MTTTEKLTQASELLQFLQENEVEFVDIRFTDLPGRWQHFSLPVHAFDQDAITKGLGFDGSSIQGFQAIEESDMLLLPDVSSGFIDPFTVDKTLAIICDVFDPQKKAAYSKDPRGVAKKAEVYLKKTGIADASYWGPEIEFFIFDKVGFSIDPFNSGYLVESLEAHSMDLADGLWIRPKEGYFPCAPMDKFQDLRSAMVKNMGAIGIDIEVHHHEVATAGQAEIDMLYGPLTKMGDQFFKYKYALRMTAAQADKTACFMPKPLFGDNGSGMHCHQSLWKGGEPIFYDANGYGELSKVAMHYVAGLLAHAPALAGITNPTVNSYRRLVPGFEAPVNLIISARNRSAVVRIPMYFSGYEARKSKRIEYRAPDASTNGYLAFAAMLMAGLDGVQRELEPPTPIDKNLYHLPAEEAAKIKLLPKSLDAALDALEADHEFLLKGGVFTEDLLESWIELKRDESDKARLRTTPIEYYMYYDL